VNREILNLLKSNPKLSATELVKKTNLSSRSVKRYLKLLREKKHIKRIGPAKGGRWEGRPDMALFLFTKAILENKPIQVFNNGNMPVPWNAKQIPLGVRDFTYVDDIVEGVTRVIDNPPSREIREANISPGPVGIQNKIPATNFSSGEEEYSANRRREVVNSDGVVEKPVASGQPPEAPYKIYNIGNSSPVPLMEYI
jgi:DNA-binding Lrp family transcriptional regulator